jgi:Gpi18-like mannosyltransferase
MLTTRQAGRAKVPNNEMKSPLENQPNTRGYEIAVAFIATTLTAFLLFLFRWMIHTTNFDIQDFYLKWYEHIVHYGRWKSLEGSYADYNPPYLYLLSLFSFLNPIVSPNVVLKLVQIPATIASGFLAWSICRSLGMDKVRALLAGWIVLVAPEVAENTLMWANVT